MNYSDVKKLPTEGRDAAPLGDVHCLLGIPVKCMICRSSNRPKQQERMSHSDTEPPGGLSQAVLGMSATTSESLTVSLKFSFQWHNDLARKSQVISVFLVDKKAQEVIDLDIGNDNYLVFLSSSASV